MRAPLRFVALMMVLAALVACSSRRQSGPEVGNPVRTTVRVENRNFQDMTVYVLNGAQRLRLGTVNGMGTRTFTIPSRVVFGITNLRFEVDPLGGSRSAPSWDIGVSPGDQVHLIIPSM